MYIQTDLRIVYTWTNTTCLGQNIHMYIRRYVQGHIQFNFRANLSSYESEWVSECKICTCQLLHNTLGFREAVIAADQYTVCFLWHVLDSESWSKILFTKFHGSFITRCCLISFILHLVTYYVCTPTYVPIYVYWNIHCI